MGGVESRIIKEIVAERIRQDRKLGGEIHDDEHEPEEWIQFILDYATWARCMHNLGSSDKYRHRLMQVAALAIAACESFDRRLGVPSPPIHEGFPDKGQCPDDSLEDIACRMAQEIQDFIDEGLEGGFNMTGPKELLEEWETIYSQRNEWLDIPAFLRRQAE